jgi:hypothetical protein
MQSSKNMKFLAAQLRPAAALLLVLALGACSGTQTANDPPVPGVPPGVDATLRSALPQLPVGSPARITSGIEITGQSGDDFYSRSTSNTSVNGLKLELHPGPDETAWAVFEFAVSGFDYGEIYLNATINNPEKAWYALADYDTGQWQWFPATEVSGTLQSLAGENRSPLGNAYLAVIACDETFVSFEGFYTEIEVPGWQSYSLVQGNLTGWISDMELINDRLYLAHQRFAFPYTNIARAMVEEPIKADDWDIRTAIENFQAVDLDLETIDGLPAMSLIADQSGKLSYYFANGLEPLTAADWTGYSIAPVKGLSSELQPQALTEVNSRPAVVYARPDGLESEVWYGIGASSQPATANDWSHHKIGNFGLVVPTHGGFAVDAMGTRPVVSLHSWSNDTFYYARGDAANPVNSSGWTRYDLFANGGSGEPSKIVVVDDVPYIAMRRGDNNQLYFLAATMADPQEAGSWDVQLIANDVGPQIDLTARPGGGFALVWRDIFDSVYYAETDLESPTKGSDWRVSEVRYNVGTNGDVSVAVTESGRPYLAFVVDSDTTEELRVFRMGVN